MTKLQMENKQSYQAFKMSSFGPGLGGAFSCVDPNSSDEVCVRPLPSMSDRFLWEMVTSKE